MSYLSSICIHRKIEYHRSPYQELVEDYLINDDKSVSRVSSIKEVPHPCTGLNANDFSLQILIATGNSDFLNNTSYRGNADIFAVSDKLDQKLNTVNNG